MLKILKYVCLLLILSSCRREYAYFQKTTTENYRVSKKQSEERLIVEENIKEKKIEEIEVPVMPEEEAMTAGQRMDVPIINNLPQDKTDLFPKGLFKKKKPTKGNEKKRGLFQKQEKKGLFEKKKKRRGFGHGFNERLKIGLVLLGIAIIFALFHINVLAIIFGLLAAFFIIRGLRKLF
jgi:hypothetical protein